MASLFAHLMRNYLPGTFVFAILLTLLTMILAFVLAGASPAVILSSWTAGLFNILTFAMQVILVLITGHALALTAPAKRLLQWIAGRGDTPVKGAMLVMFVACVGSIINWAFGLFFAGLLALEVAERVKKSDFPLLIAAAYSGQICWHQGLSGFIPLVLATSDHPQNFIFQATGHSVPLTQTIFQPYNLLPMMTLVITLPILVALIHPRGQEVREISPEALRSLTAKPMPMERPVHPTWAERLDGSPMISAALALIVLSCLFLHFQRKGADLNINIIILLFFVTGVILHGRPINYVRAVNVAIRGAGGIALQFPLYGGIMGLMMGTGLATVIARWFVALSTPETAYLMQFFGTGLLNFFVPSGGGQWAIQGPITIEAVSLIGADLTRSAMMVAWGNEWSNMIQPFWALPLLGLAGLTARDILGYTAMTFLWSGVVFTCFALLIGYHIL
ncbi:MAG: TIGR00366 family protein [Deltaproteobacteria bacterium]|nr:TIGR00366 family protein [Deltaproteobacteria bacterium]